MTELEPVAYTTQIWLDQINDNVMSTIGPKGTYKHEIALVTLSSATAAIAERDKRIAELEEENSALAAHACIFTDGSGLTGDEHGNSICLVTQRATAAEAEATSLRGLLEEARKVIEPFSESLESSDGTERDGSPIWEHPSAMAIEFRHLRAALTWMEKSR